MSKQYIDACEIDQFESTAFFSYQKSFYDDPLPTRHLLISIEDCGEYYKAEEISFYVKSWNSCIPHLDFEKPYRSTITLIPTDTCLHLIEVNYGHEPRGLAWQAVKIPCSSVPLEINFDGKYIFGELNGYDSSNTVKTICQESSEHLKSLNKICAQKGYKYGWVYYKFNEYISRIRSDRKIIFGSSYKGKSLLTYAAESYPVIPRKTV